MNEPIQVLLKKLELRLQLIFSKEFIQDVHLWEDELLQNIILRMTKDVIAYKCGSRIIKYPKNWKEAVKDRWFPGWLKKKYPVKFKEYDALVIFPQFLKNHAVPSPLEGENFYLTYIETGTYSGEKEGGDE